MRLAKFQVTFLLHVRLSSECPAKYVLPVPSFQRNSAGASQGRPRMPPWLPRSAHARRILRSRALLPAQVARVLTLSSVVYRPVARLAVSPPVSALSP